MVNLYAIVSSENTCSKEKRKVASLLELNKPAYQFQEGVFEKFQAICTPLFKLGIKYFEYFRTYKDGRYIRLINNLEYSRVYHSIVENCGLFYTNQLIQTQLNKYHYTILNNINEFDKIKDPIPHLMYDFNMWNVFRISKLNSTFEFVESYDFYTSRENREFPQFCINHLSLLEHFITYFNERAKDFLDKDDKKISAYFKQQFDFCNNNKEYYFLQMVEQFFQETYATCGILRTDTQKILLSKRQLQCLSYMSLGKTMKEAARILGLSPRTLEFYLQNLKNKSGLNRNQLLTYFIKSNPDSLS